MSNKIDKKKEKCNWYMDKTKKSETFVSQLTEAHYYAGGAEGTDDIEEFRALRASDHNDFNPIYDSNEMR